MRRKHKYHRDEVRELEAIKDHAMTTKPQSTTTKTCHDDECCAQCCLNPQHPHYRIPGKAGGFTCECCQRNMEVRINGKFCNECASFHAGAAPVVDNVGLNLLRQLVGGKNSLRTLGVFPCNQAEHEDVDCKCFWEQCEAWAQQDAGVAPVVYVAEDVYAATKKFWPATTTAAPVEQKIDEATMDWALRELADGWI